MDISDGRKDMFVKYLNHVRKAAYVQVLDCNGELVKKLYKKKLSDNLEGDPLWLFHGGELINLYSTDKNKVPTKDIDLKMYFTGDFSIPPKLFASAVKLLQSVRLSDVDFYSEAKTKAKETSLLRGFKQKLSKHKAKPGVNFFQIWDIGESQKVRMCASLVANQLKGTYSQLNLSTGQLRQGIERETMMNCRSQKWVDGDECKAFIVNTPYVTQVGRNNVPYDIGNDVLSKMDVEYEEEMDGYHIDEDFLDDLDGKVKAWTEDPKLKSRDQKQAFLERKLKFIRMKHQKFKLSTVVGVVLVYNESRGEWYMFQEGLLDTFIDYSAGHHLDLEKKYAGRYQDGSFPSILRKVPYSEKNKKKMGIMRFPSLTWLIYDQLRMLYVTIRGEHLGCDEHKCKWVPLGGGAAGNHEKYFKKLKGMLSSFETVIQGLHSGDLEEVQKRLAHCNKLNVEECGPLPFLGDLFQSFEMDLLRDRRAGSKKTKKVARAKKAKRAKTKKETRERHTQRHSQTQRQAKSGKTRKSSSSKLQQEMEMMNQGIYLE